MELNETLPTWAETIEKFNKILEDDYGCAVPKDVEIYLKGYPDIVEPVLDVLQAIHVCDERTINSRTTTIKMISGEMHEHYKALVIELDSDALSLQELININNYKDLLLDGLNGRVIIKYRKA
jgi:hypothetical protein